MLATVGWFFPKIFGTFDSQDVTTTDPIDAILQADPQWWAQWILICGVFETYKYKKEMEGKSFLGGDEPAVDYLKLWPADEAGRADMRMKELKVSTFDVIANSLFFIKLTSNHCLIFFTEWQVGHDWNCWICCQPHPSWIMPRA
jgi:hypothetical protein